MARSSRDAGPDLERAEKARKRGRRRFRSAKQAVAWYFEARERMQSPVGRHPRGETLPNGEQVIMRVDGGSGGDIDGVLATISTIGSAIESLRRHDSRWGFVLVASVRDGIKQGDLALKFKVSQPTVSGWIGRAEAFIAGILVHAELI